MKKKLFRKIATLICIAMLTISMQSCYRKFYIVSDSNNSKDPVTVIKQQTGKYFILRPGTSAYHMENIVTGSSDKSIKFVLGSLSKDHLSYLSVFEKKGIVDRKSEGEEVVLNEVHVYTPADRSMHYRETYQFDFIKNSKNEVLEKDNGRKTQSTVISTTGIVVSAAAILTGVNYIAFYNSL